MMSLLLVLFAGGVASVQAENALPGDVLYPVKVGFNEKMKMVLAFSEQEKVQLNIELAEVRLREAEKLALKGRITKDAQDQIASNFNMQANEAAKKIEEMDDFKAGREAAAQASSDLQALLNAHGHVLKKIQEIKDGKSGQNLDSLITNVDNISQKIEEEPEQQKFAAKADSLDKFTENQFEAAKKAVEKAKEMIEKRKEKMGDVAVSQALNNLELAKQKIEEGKKEMENKNYFSATSIFQQATVMAKESANLIKAKTDLGVDININIQNRERNRGYDR
jgi:hypothetical protein